MNKADKTLNIAGYNKLHSSESDGYTTYFYGDVLESSYRELFFPHHTNVVVIEQNGVEIVLNPVEILGLYLKTKELGWLDE